MSLALALVDLPVSFVEAYALERRFGLSDQSERDWLGDYAKGALISSALAAVIAMLFGFALVRRSPKRWPILAGVGAFPLFVLGNLIVPLYVLPLFNRFEPVTGALERRLRELATRFGVGDAAILQMDISRQTRKANAFVVGIGEAERIVLGDTLIEAFPDAETEFVVAHELGHYVNKDTWRLIGLGEVLAFVLFSGANGAISQRDRDELRERPLLVVRLLRADARRNASPSPAALRVSQLSREWAADRFALAARATAPRVPRLFGGCETKISPSKIDLLVRVLLLFAPIAESPHRRPRGLLHGHSRSQAAKSVFFARVRRCCSSGRNSPKSPKASAKASCL